MTIGTMNMDGELYVQVQPGDGMAVYGEATISDNTMALLLGDRIDTTGVQLGVNFTGSIEQQTIGRLRPQPDGYLGAFNIQPHLNLLDVIDANTTFSVGFNSSSSAKSPAFTFDATSIPVEFRVGHNPISNSQRNALEQPGDLFLIDSNSMGLFVEGDISLDNLPHNLAIDGYAGAQFAMDSNGSQIDLLLAGTANLGMLGSVSTAAFLEVRPTRLGGYLQLQGGRLWSAKFR